MTISASKRSAAVALMLFAGLLATAMRAQSAAPENATAAAPANSPTDTSGLTALSAKIDALAGALEQTRAELAAARAEIRELRSQMRVAEDADASPTAAEQSLSSAVAALQEQQQVLVSQVAQHDQTKVETASKYPLRVTGLLLFNALRSEGAVDNPYAPTVAVPSYETAVHGSLQGTLRQTVLGLDARGPRIAGAASSADIRTDFFGGLADYSSSASSPPYDQLLRLRTFHVGLDWPETRVAFEYDRPIISPHTPTSLSAVGVPALAWSGNLWNWQPQLISSHRLAVGDEGKVEFAAGLMDVPDPLPSSLVSVSAAERSRYPGSEIRLGYLLPRTGAEDTSFGIGGYWSPHDYGPMGSVDAWAVTADYSITLPAHLALTGLVYRGAALGGLGGGTFKDIVSLPVPGAENYLEALHDIGGWSQLKFNPTRRVELNAAFGADDSDANQLRQAVYAGPSTYTALARNQTSLGNVIYRPNSYLLFSAEYRYVRSWQILNAAVVAQIYSLSTGYQF